MRSGFLFLLLISALSWAQPEPKKVIDRSQPVRTDILYQLLSNQGEVVGLALLSTRIVLDPEFRDSSFTRVLLHLEDGTRAALYNFGDFSSSPAKFFDLVVDLKSSEWVLLRSELPQAEGGWKGLRKAADGGARAVVSVETRRWRLPREWEESTERSRVAEVFSEAEPELLSFLQRLRQELGPISPAKDPNATACGGLRATLDHLAHVLRLPEVPPRSCQLREVKRQFAEDHPQRPAKPLDPEFEGRFGRWASWGELPRLRQ